MAPGARKTTDIKHLDNKTITQSRVKETPPLLARWTPTCPDPRRYQTWVERDLDSAKPARSAAEVGDKRFSTVLIASPFFEVLPRAIHMCALNNNSYLADTQHHVNLVKKNNLPDSQDVERMKACRRRVMPMLRREDEIVHSVRQWR